MKSRIIRIGITILFLVFLTVILTAPETFKERIYPYDAALFAANGTFFLSAFKDLANFISSPANWMWDYYYQYPALFIRRHPPILGLVESVMFAMFGISAVTAKLTIHLFSISWIIGWFFALRKMFKDEFIAFFTTLLMLTLPMSVSLGSSVRADIPSMMFFAWGCYFFVCYSESAEKKHKYAILTALLLSCSLYTYQLPMFGVIALFLYMVANDWGNLFKRSDFYLGSILFILLMLPLLFFILKFSNPIEGIILGKINKDILAFVPVQSRLSLDNWIFYLKVIWEYYPLYITGLALWGLSKIGHRPQKYELFFLLWFLIGYIGFSIIPSKTPRYAYHFIIAALPLTVIGIKNVCSLIFLNKKKFELAMFAVSILLIVGWNISGIRAEMSPYVEDIDKAVKVILSEQERPNILYHGAFENAFIFYVVKHDRDRRAKVLRTTNQMSDLETLAVDIKKKKIDFIVYEAENLRRGAHGGIYDRFYEELGAILNKEESPFNHFRDFRVSYGKPGREREYLLKVYRVDND